MERGGGAMSRVVGLRCKECGKEQAKDPVAACAGCWGGLEPVYDLDEVRRTFTPETLPEMLDVEPFPALQRRVRDGGLRRERGRRSPPISR